jgi:hypothetical protein
VFTELRVFSELSRFVILNGGEAAMRTRDEGPYDSFRRDAADGT